MAQTNIQIRIDEDLKREFTELCDELGLTVTTACCAFIKKAVKEQRIPFDLSVSNNRKERIKVMDYKSIKEMVDKKVSEGKKLPLSGENENGETVVITAGSTEDNIHYYSLMTIQNNNWIRTNEYYEDGTVTEEYEK